MIKIHLINFWSKLNANWICMFLIYEPMVLHIYCTHSVSQLLTDIVVFLCLHHVAALRAVDVFLPLTYQTSWWMKLPSWHPAFLLHTGSIYLSPTALIFLFLFLFTPPIPDSSYTSHQPLCRQTNEMSGEFVFFFQMFVPWHVFCHFAERVNISSENS